MDLLVEMACDVSEGSVESESISTVPYLQGSHRRTLLFFDAVLAKASASDNDAAEVELSTLISHSCVLPNHNDQVFRIMIIHDRLIHLLGKSGAPSNSRV